MSSFTALLQPGAPNLGLHSLVVHLFLSGLPHWISIALAEKNRVNGGWDNRNPRTYVAVLNAKLASGKKLTATEWIILRGQAAQQNGFEWFALYAVAILAANAARLPSSDINRAALVHMLSRAAYNYLYMTTDSKPFSFARTLAFWIESYASLRLIHRAGNVFL